MKKLALSLIALSLPMLAMGQDDDGVDPSAPVISQAPTSAPGSAIPETRGGMTLLFDNGPFVTQPGGGFGGADISVVQFDALGMNSFGRLVSIAGDRRAAEDFTVPAGEVWRIDVVELYSFQVDSTTTSTLNEVRLQIWDGVPDAPGSSVVFGNLTDDLFLATAWTNVYRVSDLPGAAVDTRRPVMSITADLGSGGVSLPAGTYWLDWQIGGTLASGPWQVPITIPGQVTTGNALQYSPATPGWGPMIDSGTSTQLGAPFSLLGAATVLAPDVGVAPPVLNFGSIGVGNSATLSATITNTGTAAGDFTWTSVSAPFSLQSSSCGAQPATLAAGATCVLTYAFAPTAVGPVPQQTVTVQVNASTQSFDLTGTGALVATPPQFIPSAGTWALLLLGGLVLLIAVRRSSAQG
ncbi:MAG: choice-of-anchor D domain-containing protein [Lysobacteraceae bacterium]